jgi:hypothetical protein
MTLKKKETPGKLAVDHAPAVASSSWLSKQAVKRR